MVINVKRLRLISIVGAAGFTVAGLIYGIASVFYNETNRELRDDVMDSFTINEVSLTNSSKEKVDYAIRVCVLGLGSMILPYSISRVLEKREKDGANSDVLNRCQRFAGRGSNAGALGNQYLGDSSLSR